MRPMLSRLAVLAMSSIIVAATQGSAAAQGGRGVQSGASIASPGSGQRFHGAVGQVGRFADRSRRTRGCGGYGECGGLVFAGGTGFTGYGGYGGYGYGYDYGVYGFDPRQLRGDLPNDRESAVPAVAGIPASPVLPPAIYVIEGSTGGLARRQASRERRRPGQSVETASAPRVIRVR